MRHQEMSISGISSQLSYAVTGNVNSFKEMAPHARKMTESEMAEMKNLPSIHEHAAQQTGRPDNSPENLFAEITVHGKVVAKVWDTGLAQTPRDLQLNMDGGGLSFAQERAEEIAKKLGGEINYATKASSDTTQPNSYSFSDSLARILNSYR
jgi:hypothetical protein|tara:strand:+ start:332 stop:787 length:456 start_codon:yes stop_codon:yes gene_type:complete